MLTESSGVAASLRRQPGILWTMNDSGHDACHLRDRYPGPATHGAFAVAGAENRDWEAIAIGPCGQRDCLYIADTGDNGRTRTDACGSTGSPEPSRRGQPLAVTSPAEVLEVPLPRRAAGRRGDVRGATARCI